jgi:sigma-E factor negative regulatory protein RseB
MVTGWRIAGLAALVGLLGSGVAGLAFADSPASSPVAKRPNLNNISLRLMRPVQSAPPNVGLQLLQQAAAACKGTSYSGEQVVLWWGPGENSASVVEVWHQPGRMTLVQAASGPATLAGPAAATQSTTSPDQDPDGILGVSDQLLTLLQSNYQVAYAGHGSVAGRPALVVEVRRLGGGLAALFWLDAATKLPLRREIFASGSHLVSEDAFISLQIGDRGLTAMPAPAAAPWTARLDDARLTSLRADGWPVPGQLPGNLMLFAATETTAPSGQVIDLSYSDGLAVVSVFVQRGQLGQPMPGWRLIRMSGQTVYLIDPNQRSFAWSSGGFVYTVIADAPMATVSQVVAAMPTTGRTGFWGRMSIGFRRLASWLNPLH